MSLRHLLKGSVLSAGDQIIRGFAALIVTPVMVAALGVADFGTWVLLTALFGQFVLLDPGLQSSLPRFLIQKDADELCKIASTAQRIYGVVAAASALVTIFIWMSLPWFVADGARLFTARSMVILLGSASVLTTLIRLPALYLQSQMRRDLISGIAIARIGICTAITLWLLLRRKGGLLDVALVHSAGAVVESLLLAYFGRKLYACIRPRWVDRKVARSLLGFSGWAYLITLCERLRSGLDGFILGWLRGNQAAGFYSLGARPVCMAFDTVYACIGTQLLPAFTRLRLAGDQGGLGSVFVSITRLSAYLSMTSAGIIWVLGPPFLRWWVPAQADEAVPVLLCLALPFALQTAQVPAIHLLYAVAEHRVLALVQTVGLVLNITLSIVFAYWLGIIGAALGTVVEILLLHGLVMPMLIAWKVNVSPSKFLWWAQIVPLFASIAAIGVPAIMIWKWMPTAPTIWHLITVAAAMAVWLVGWAWVFRCGKAEMKELGHILTTPII